MYVLELPHKADDPDALERWVHEVRKFKEHVERRFDIPITEAKLRTAIELMNRERRLRRELAGLMAVNAPPMTGRQLLSFKSIISGIDADLQQYSRALEFYRSRATTPRQGERPVRALLTGVPLVTGAERVVELIENCGAIVVAMENCTGLKPILEDVQVTGSDPIRAIAEKYYHLPCSVMTPNRKRLESLSALASRFRPDCVIELVWQACLTYDIEAYQVRKLVEEELHLPYLKVTTDYSPSDSARIAARVEALLEIARSRRGTLE